jgi:tyrosyl-tRNA synthetase
MYGKLMSISDASMRHYFDLLRAGGWEDLRGARDRLERGEGDPMAFKHALATRVVARFHGDAAAEQAAERFRSVIQRKEAPTDLAPIEVPAGAAGARGLLDLLVELKMVRSTSEARRLVEQRAVQIDGRAVEDPALRLPRGEYLLRLGKRRFARLRIG